MRPWGRGNRRRRGNCCDNGEATTRSPRCWSVKSEWKPISSRSRRQANHERGANSVKKHLSHKVRLSVTNVERKANARGCATKRFAQSGNDQPSQPSVGGEENQAQITDPHTLTPSQPRAQLSGVKRIRLRLETKATHFLLSEQHVGGSVDGVPVTVLVDTGAAVRENVWDEISQKYTTRTLEMTQKRLIGVQGMPLVVLGVTNVMMMFGGEEFQTEVIVADTLSSGAIISRDILQQNKCVIDLEQNTLKFKQRGITLLLNAEPGSQQIARIAITLDHSLDVPRSSELETMVKVPAAARGRTWIVERNTEERVAGIVARAVQRQEHTHPAVQSGRQTKKGTTIAMMEPLENDS